MKKESRFSSSRTAFFGNGYGVEFIVTDPFTITFNVVTEKDVTLVTNSSTIVGTDQSLRNEDNDVAESLHDFAVRARLEGIAFAENCIAEHKESLELSSALNEVLAEDMK